MIPNYLADVQAAKAKYPEAWSHAHVDGDPKRWDFIRLLGADLHAKDFNVGLNGKRGNPNDLSMDALNILCTAGDSDGRTPNGVSCAVVDVIGGAGGPNPVPTWNVFTTVVEGSGAWVSPQAVPVPAPVDCSSKFPPQDQVFEFGKALNEKYRVDRHAPMIGVDQSENPPLVIYVNLKGMSIWLGDYMRHRVAGKTHDEAQALVFASIDAVP